jgi:multidrug efflux pump subunit AcrB
VELLFARQHSLDDLTAVKIRNASGQLVSLSQIVKAKEKFEPVYIDRLNLQPMVRVHVNPAADASPAQVWATCKSVAAEVRKELGLGEAYRLQWFSTQSEPEK